jgi:hypothetical protein
MFCRNCGKEVRENAEICVNCGVRPLAERGFCQECGVETKPNQELCIKCGCRLRTDVTAGGSGAPLKLNLAGLSPYYQKEFKKIWESQESYKGKWNWAAFLFGSIWAMTKGAWLGAIVGLVIGVLTAGIGFMIWWFVYGFRGNWMFYNVHVKSKQIVS